MEEETSCLKHSEHLATVSALQLKAPTGISANISMKGFNSFMRTCFCYKKFPDCCITARLVVICIDNAGRSPFSIYGSAEWFLKNEKYRDVQRGITSP